MQAQARGYVGLVSVLVLFYLWSVFPVVEVR